MGTQTYDEKNESDYEKGTKLIEQALAQIEADRSLRVNKAELANITKMSRNSFAPKAARGYVGDLLSKIKADRKKYDNINEEDEKSQTENFKENAKNLGKEVAIWFSKYVDLHAEYQQLESIVERKVKITDWFEKELDSERKKNIELRKKLSDAQELLRVVK